MTIGIIGMQCTPLRASLTSSYWYYSDDDDVHYEIYFRPDGHISSYHPNDATPENDYWKQKGNTIRLYMNDRHASYKGQIINDTTMLGKGKSKGFRWTWKAKFISKD